MASLFTEFRLKDVRLKNRIGVSPMCQYSARDGFAGDWHLVHLGARAIGGAALVIAEATAVAPEGRITPGCTGIWSDIHAERFMPITRFIKAQGCVAGIQLAHAGRKASAYAPWDGKGDLPSNDPRAWQPIGPSDLAFGGSLNRRPRAMTKDDIQRVQRDFAEAAKRALAAGFEWLELHFAHGYLAQSFFSPIANKRADEYGGNFDGRARFILETFSAVRSVWPERLPLTVRLGITDLHPESQPIEESIELVRELKSRGLDLVQPESGWKFARCFRRAFWARIHGSDSRTCKTRSRDSGRGKLADHRAYAGGHHHPRRTRGPRSAGARHAERPTLAVPRG